MLNETHTPDCIRVIATYPAVPAAGGVVVYGKLTGVAQGSEDADGYTVTQFGPFIGTFSVVSSGAIAKGDSIFASESSPVVLSNISTGIFFGWANAAIASGTATIEVIKAGYAGGILAANAIGTTQLAASAVTAAKLGAAAVSAVSLNYEVATLVFGDTDVSKTAAVTLGNIIVGHYVSSVTGVPVGWPIQLVIASTTLTATASAAPGTETGYTLNVVMLKAAGV